MIRTILHRLFRLGAIPRKMLPVLQQEGIEVADEGMGGWFLTRRVKGPGKRYRHRAEGFSGCLVITRKRVFCTTFWKRQMNIGADDPRMAELVCDAPDARTLSLSFESSVFRPGWEGVIEFRFKTDKALQFCDALRSIGARQASG